MHCTLAIVCIVCWLLYVQFVECGCFRGISYVGHACTACCRLYVLYVRYCVCCMRALQAKNRRCVETVVAEVNKKIVRKPKQPKGDPRGGWRTGAPPTKQGDAP